ncbi:head maturation protease, ClpP-related [Maledivibacter halophilus]|uniref:ATP-dependent Clp protease proteolytic subunit n=1 Tax=Maledivibacter halophilus TaxID=36842 RepID=A0A1T5K289_9FIRM|nr:head maturation protease, ClpP-related [Maledivibacter halophilus]SKC57751.1 ATP-dependent Clp protease, protease subunit [Maledivibacter halophilus]
MELKGKKNKKFWNFKSLDKNQGELTLYGEISNETWWGDEVTPKEFKADLDNLGDVDTLNIYINSPGGDVFAGQTIYSILKRHKAQKNVYIDGLAASIASVIAMAGNTIFMPKNSMMMIHNPWTIGMGNAADFRKLAEDLDKIRESLIAAYENQSMLTRDEIIEIMDNETWLTAKECEEYGFCHVVEEEKKIAASVDMDVLGRYRNTPKALIQEPKPDNDVQENNQKSIKQKLLIELEL